MITATLTPERHAAFKTTGEVWLPVPMMPCSYASGTAPSEGHVCDGLVPDPAWLALTEPCETCGGTRLVPNAQGSPSIFDSGPGKLCPDCVDGRKRIELRVPCPEVEGPFGQPGQRCLDDTSHVAHEWFFSNKANYWCQGTGTVLVATASVAEVWRIGKLGMPKEWYAPYLGDPDALVGTWLALVVKS